MSTGSANQVNIGVALDPTKLSSGLSDASTDINKFARQTNGVMSSLLSGFGMGIGASIFGMVKNLASGAIGMLKDGFSDFHEADQVFQAMAGAIETSGQAAGWSADQLKSFAEEREKATNFSAEETMKAATSLSAFGNIQGDEFLRTLTAAQDMSTQMGTSFEGAAKTIALALESPTQALTRLTRAGVRFTDEEQKMVEEMVKAGDMAAAQNVILSRLEDTYGGLSETAADPFVVMKNAWGDIKESVMAPFMDSIYKLTGALQTGVAFIKQNVIPIWNTWAEMALGGLDAIWDGVKWLGEQFVESMIDVMAFGQTVWDNFGLSFDIAATSVSLGITSLVNDIVHLFTNDLPENIKWFWNNFGEIASKYTQFVVDNFKWLGDTAKELWNGVIKFVATGEWDVNIENPLDRMKSQLGDMFKGMPGITERAKTEYEQQLADQLKQYSDEWGHEFDENRRAISDSVHGWLESLVPQQRESDVGSHGETAGYRQYEGEKEEGAGSSGGGLESLESLYTRIMTGGEDKQDKTNQLLEETNQELSAIREGVQNVDLSTPSVSAISREVTQTFKERESRETTKTNPLAGIMTQQSGTLNSINSTLAQALPVWTSIRENTSNLSNQTVATYQ